MEGLGLTDGSEARQIAQNVIPLDELLKNPVIEGDDPCKMDIKIGKHHGNDVVAIIGETISNSRLLSYYVKEVTSAEYGPGKRGHLEVRSNHIIKNHYYIIVYDKRRDAGYGAKIELYAKDKWKVAIISKILRNKIRYFNDYVINIIED